MNKLLKVLDKVISVILMVLAGFLAVGVTVTVVLRYFFGLSFSTLEEFLTMSFIFITLFGSAIAIREKQHISISFLADKVVGDSEKKKTISVILVDVSIIFVCAVMFVFSCKWIGQVGHLLSQNSHLPMKVYYVVMPITFALTIIYCIFDILGRFVKIDEADSGYSTDDKLPEED
ncbi:MAG: TRAP transporter small permease subunit [Sphaerochaetaceae bacterium]|nr:TRAP transporter small permease subunit [Sphaerochaetaceae bacterium]